MKRSLLMLGAICFLLFSITGCDSGSKAPDNKAAEDAAKTLDSAIEKTKEAAEATTEAASDAADASKEMASEAAQAVEEKTADVVDAAKEAALPKNP